MTFRASTQAVVDTEPTGPYAAFGSGGNYRTYQRACGTYEEDAFVYLRKRTIPGPLASRGRSFVFRNLDFCPNRN